MEKHFKNVKSVTSQRSVHGKRRNVTASGGHVKTTKSKVPKGQIWQHDLETE